MKWPWERLRVDEDEARRADEALARVRADEPRVAHMVAEHRRQQEQNCFGPTVHNALALPRRERHS